MLWIRSGKYGASRKNACAVVLQNNIYQLDEIRAMEDLPPLDFNFIKLGLDAVLVDTKTATKTNILIKLFLISRSIKMPLLEKLDSIWNHYRPKSK